MEFDLIAICGITFLVAVLVFLVSWGICYAIYINMRSWTDDYLFLTWLIALIIGVCAWVGLIFMGIGLNTNAHKAYIQSYLMQKQTIHLKIGRLEALQEHKKQPVQT